MFGVKALLSTLILAAIPSPQDATLLFVTTPGCVPCRQFAPLVREIAEMGFSVETVDASKHPELVRDQLQVQQFPTFLMLSNDRIVDRVVPSAGPVAMKPRILKMFEMRVAESPVQPLPPAVAASPAVTPIAVAASPNTGNIAPAFAPPSQWELQNNTVTQASAVTTAPSDHPAPPRRLPPVEENPFSLTSAQSPGLASSVKLRVDAENTHSWGTGTIVDARQGEALVLTCGHIFRDSAGKGKIEVHLFAENSSVCVFGRCLYYDLEIDLALVVIAPPCPVRATPIAPDRYQVTPGDRVLSVGCDGGANPTVRAHRIMSVDRIGTPRENAMPFHYIQVSGAPVSGRSGGGLFDENGYLIGVCNTADPVENDGHFVPPHVIRHVLQKMQLTAVYENPSLTDEPRAPQAELARSAEPVAAEWQPEIPQPLKPLAPISRPEPVRQEPMEVQARSTTKSEIQLATLEEIKRRAQDGDEIIVYIKSRRNPEIPGDVIRLNDE